MDVVADLVPLLGRAPDTPTAERLAALVSGPRDDSRHGRFLEWSWNTAGISVRFIADTLDYVRLNAIPLGGQARFEGTVPGGLALDARRREVRAALGTPTEQGVPEPQWCDAADYFHDDTIEPHITGYSYFWDRYEHAGYRLQFTYAWEGEPGTGHHVGRDLWTGDADELRATVVQLSRPGAQPWYTTLAEIQAAEEEEEHRRALEQQRTRAGRWSWRRLVPWL
jgi:hypothetical protein